MEGANLNARAEELARRHSERFPAPRNDRERLRLKYKHKRSNKRVRWILTMLWISFNCGGRLLPSPPSSVDEDLFEFDLSFAATGNKWEGPV